MHHYYINTNKSWYPDEDAKLINTHKYKSYTIIQLANIHKRTPGNIMRRLKKLRLIKYTSEIRGYESYRNSDLFYILNPAIEEKHSTLDSAWTKDEDNKLFQMQSLNLQELAQTLNRHPGEVAHRMKDLKLVKALHLIDGFNIYKNTLQYIEFQRIHRKKKAALPDTSSTALLKSEVDSIREELIKLRESFTDLCSFIRSAFRNTNSFKLALEKLPVNLKSSN